MSDIPVFIVDGVDFTKYVKLEGGIKLDINDLDSDDSGRTMDGVMWRTVIAKKRQIDVQCVPLTWPRLSALSAAVAPTFISVTYPDTGGNITKTFYGTKISATLSRRRGDTCEWDKISFTLTER